AEDGIRDFHVTGVQTCALPIFYAGEHPIIRGPAIPFPRAPLEPLSTIPDVELAEGEPDIRRWPLHAGGRRVGTIDDLVVDPAARSEERRVGKERRARLEAHPET